MDSELVGSASDRLKLYQRDVFAGFNDLESSLGGLSVFKDPPVRNLIRISANRRFNGSLLRAHMAAHQCQISLLDQLTPEIWAKIEACHPLGMGRPDDVAAAVAFLASSDARWITGITLPLGWAYHYPLPTGQMIDP